MNKEASMVFLSGALALTIFSVCASALAEEHVTPAVRGISETQARIKSLLVRDPQLVTDIAMSREAIWDVLTDRTKFAGLG